MRFLRILIWTIAFVIAAMFGAAQEHPNAKWLQDPVAGKPQLPELPALSELDKYKLQAAVTKADFESLRIQTVIQNFIATNPQVKEWNESAQRSTSERDALITQLFQTAKLSQSEYLIDMQTGQFKRRTE